MQKNGMDKIKKKAAKEEEFRVGLCNGLSKYFEVDTYKYIYVFIDDFLMNANWRRINAHFSYITAKVVRVH